MTPEEPPHRPYATASEPPTSNHDPGILRAGRPVAASRRQHRGDPALVRGQPPEDGAPDRPQPHGASPRGHVASRRAASRSAPATSPLSTGNAIRPAAGRATKQSRIPLAGTTVFWRRYASRSRRRTRFREALPPSRRLTANPTARRPGTAIHTSTNPGRSRRDPRRNSRSNSAGSRSRSARPSVARSGELLGDRKSTRLNSSHRL